MAVGKYDIWDKSHHESINMYESFVITTRLVKLLH